MAGAGLQELLEVVFAGNATYVDWQNYIQSIFWHMLIDAALITILVANVYHIPLPTKDKQYTACCHKCSILSHTTCKICISIAANEASSARISSRCPLECHGRTPCPERCWAGFSTYLIIEQVSMRSIKDTWRPDQRPRNDREPALDVGVLSMLICTHQ